MVQIGAISRDEVIDPDHPKALGQQPVGQVTPKKSGAPGDNCGFHQNEI
jgi:hypothetical protein